MHVQVAPYPVELNEQGRLTAAISGVGSNAIDDVVPCVEHTKHGTIPAATSDSIIDARASARMANDSSCGTTRSRSVPMPAMRSPFSTLECACAVAYATSREVSPSPLTAPIDRPSALVAPTTAQAVAAPWLPVEEMVMTRAPVSTRPPSERTIACMP